MSDNSLSGHAEMTENDKAAPELFRGRARSMATLAATGAGAIAAGVAYSPVGSTLPHTAKLLGLGSVTLLALSVLMYSSSATFSRDDVAEVGKEVEYITAYARAVRRRMIGGNVFGSLGVLSILASLFSAVLVPVPTYTATVQLVEATELHARSVCPGLSGPFIATLSRASVVGNSLVDLELAAETCGRGQPTVTLSVFRESILYMLES